MPATLDAPIQAHRFETVIQYAFFWEDWAPAGDEAEGEFWSDLQDCVMELYQRRPHQWTVYLPANIPMRMPDPGSWQQIAMASALRDCILKNLDDHNIPCVHPWDMAVTTLELNIARYNGGWEERPL